MHFSWFSSSFVIARGTWGGLMKHCSAKKMHKLKIEGIKEVNLNQMIWYGCT